ncbi:MAG TPA: DUF5658 family protein [Tepidisphaeraceae bacterium]|jgi:hypothetical protein
MGPLPLSSLADHRHRHRRVAELIVVLWMLSLADLFFTLWAHFFTPFHELNPLAGYMLRRNLVPSLILFKLVVTAIGTQIFWRLRHHGRAELALWALVGAYVLLAMRWSNYTTTALAMI